MKQQITAKEKLLKAIKDAGGLRTVKIGDTLNIYSPGATEDIEKQIQRALRNGKMIVRANGTKEWMSCDPIIDTRETKESAMYTWHPDGERVRCVWEHYVQFTNGHIDKTIGKECWRKY